MAVVRGGIGVVPSYQVVCCFFGTKHASCRLMLHRTVSRRRCHELHACVSANRTLSFISRQTKRKKKKKSQKAQQSKIQSRQVHECCNGAHLVDLLERFRTVVSRALGDQIGSQLCRLQILGSGSTSSCWFQNCFLSTPYCKGYKNGLRVLV